MFKKILDKLTGSDGLIRAARKPDRHAFAHLFGRSLVTFLQLPPGLEQGIDPNISREDLLAVIASAARGLSQRTEFTPFCRVLNDRHSMLLFTRMPLAE